MLNFLFYMHTAGDIHLTSPIVIPHPTFICALALTLCVTIGYCYIFVYKIALYGCDRAVESQDWQHLTIDSILRLTIAAYAFVSLIYIIQRSYVGNLRATFDRITRNTINFVFGLIWFRFLLLKALFIIEQFCRDQTDVDSVIKNFCPPYIKNGFSCSKTSLHKEQHIWYRLHYGLLKSAIVTCASELIPVLLVAHWIACGQAKKIAQQSLTDRMMNKKKVMTNYQKMFNLEVNKFPQMLMLIASKNHQITLKCFSILLIVLSILLWLLCFHNYIKDNGQSVAVFVQDMVEVFTGIIQLCFFINLFILTRQIPKDGLDTTRAAESRADHVLLLGSTIILTVECVCELVEISYFSPKKRMHFVTKLLDIFYSLFTQLANWFEIYCLKKIATVNDDLVKRIRNTMPYVAFSGIILNFSVFVMTYFYIETEKHHLQEIIRSLPSDYFVLVGVVGRILDTANYVYTFTSALCWVDVLLRYKNTKLFVIGGKYVEENKQNYKIEETAEF
ncbi:hypothetical protein niasHT_001347 [Heterodera trifolii]|uniref:Gustatory receptor n=1 Tax=Heterodera trifolii TaxID=157864 RepID=A0ABD2LMX5_9BILA